MTDLAQWADRVLATVEQDGAVTARLRLVTTHDDQTWETWHAPFPPAVDWVVSAQGYLRNVEQEWPARQVSVMFVAETQSGEVLSRLPMTVTGKRKGGGALSGTESQAVSIAFENLAGTMERLQRLINVQLDAARKTAETNAITMHSQSELIRLMGQRRMVSEVDGPAEDGLGALVRDNAPMLLELATDFVKKWQPKG